MIRCQKFVRYVEVSMVYTNEEMGLLDRFARTAMLLSDKPNGQVMIDETKCYDIAKRMIVARRKALFQEPRQQNSTEIDEFEFVRKARERVDQ